MRYWLMKSEPDEFSIDDLAAAKGRTTPGSACATTRRATSCATRCASATARSSTTRVARSRGSPASSRSPAQAYPDATQFDRKSPYYDPKATRDAPRWFNVDVTLVEKMRFVPLAELRAHAELARMRVLQRGNRLSITPVDPAEWTFVLKLAGRKR